MAKTDANLRVVELLGAVVFLAPFVRVSCWTETTYRNLLAASFLLFVILFNKMAESPTYILAVMGVAMWWVSRTVRYPTDGWLLGLVIVLTSLSPTDLFPQAIQEGFFQPYTIKAVPCLLVWIRILWEIFRIEITTQKSRAQNQ